MFSFHSVTTEAQLASTVSYLYRKYTMGSTGFNTNMYYGDYQDNFYILKNCWASENRQPSDSNDFNVYCQQASCPKSCLRADFHLVTRIPTSPRVASALLTFPHSCSFLSRLFYPC